MSNQETRGYSIVMADDDIEDQALVKQAMREQDINHVFTSVYNGVQLMDFLLKRGVYKTDPVSPPDLMIIDITMHLLDGFGVIELVKSNPELKQIPVYVLTTSSSPVDINKAKELGADGFFTKPDTYEKLQVIINEICSQFLANKQIS